MKTRWYRRVGGKHVKFNLSKSGVSTSFKLGPITINPQRNTYSINTPIKGLSLRGNLANKDKEAEPAEKDIYRAMKDVDEWLIIGGVLGAALVIYTIWVNIQML